MTRGSGIAAIIIGMALISSLLVFIIASEINTENRNVISTGGPGVPYGAAPPKVLMLHSPLFVQGIIKHALILPNVTTLGQSYRIVGVSVDQLNLTASNGYQWGTSIYVWNGTFVNGTTTDSEIQRAGGVIFWEGALPLSTPMAQETLPEPPTHCVSFVKNGSSSCSTQTGTAGDYLVNQDGETILVNPQYHNLFLTYPDRHMVVTIYGGSHTVAEGLELASSLTQAAAALQG